MTVEPKIIVERFENSDSVLQVNGPRKTPAISYRVAIGFEGHTFPYGYISYEARAIKMNGMFFLEETRDGACAPAVDNEIDPRRFSTIGPSVDRASADKELIPYVRIALRNLQTSIGLEIRDLTNRLGKIKIQ